MRRALYGVVMALGFAGLAHAADFIVVNSTDPSIKRGQAFDAGSRVPLAAGKTLTVMRPSGEVSTVKGGPTGATLPGMKLAQADAARFDALRALVQPPPEGRTFGARRGGMCAPVETLTTMEAILHAAETGCKTVAREALDAYVVRAQGSDAVAPST